jgi:hypothetical protein
MKPRPLLRTAARRHRRSEPCATLAPVRRYTDPMQLRNARLCLDCEEIHEAQQCPLCASETFAFMTRWVPARERRNRPRTAESSRPEELQTYRSMLTPEQQGTSWKIVQRGALGLALFGVAGWLWKSGGPDGARKDASDDPDAVR